MADDLGVQFFTTANAQHEGVTKWYLIVLAVLAYLHFALVVPFAEQTARKAEVDRELAANRTLGDQLTTPIVDSVTALETHLRADVKTVTTGLRNDLVARFDVLTLSRPYNAGDLLDHVRLALHVAVAPVRDADLPLARRRVPVTSKPSRSRIARDSASGTSTPSSFVTRSRRRRTLRGGSGLG